jgi:hypothetical protein
MSTRPNLPPLALGSSGQSGQHSSTSDRGRGRIEKQTSVQTDMTPHTAPSDRPSSDPTDKNEAAFSNNETVQKSSENQKRQELLQKKLAQSESLNELNDIAEAPISRRSDRPTSKRTITTVTTTSTARNMYSAREDNQDEDDDNTAWNLEMKPSEPGNKLRNRQWGLSFCQDSTPRKIRPKPCVLVWIKYKIFNVLWVS